MSTSESVLQSSANFLQALQAFIRYGIIAIGFTITIMFALAALYGRANGKRRGFKSLKQSQLETFDLEAAVRDQAHKKIRTYDALVAKYNRPVGGK